MEQFYGSTIMKRKCLDEPRVVRCDDDDDERCFYSNELSPELSGKE